jgi:hypothetical protein
VQEHPQVLLNPVSEKAATIQTASQRTSLVNHAMIAKIAENVKIVVIHLMTLLMIQQLLQFLFDDSFEKKQNELLTQPRSLVTAPENHVDVRVARVAANHEKVKMPLQKHLRMFLHFDVLLNEMDVNAERVLTRQFLTD